MKIDSGWLVLCAVVALWLLWPEADPPTPPPKSDSERSAPDAASAAAGRSIESANRSIREESDGDAPDGASEAGSLLVKVRWRDADPAIGIPIFAIEYRRFTRTFRRWIEWTDEQGEARFEDLPIGSVLITSARDEFEFHDPIQIEPGSEATYELELAGVTVYGTVVDAMDRPVPDAQVVAMATQNHRSPQVLTRTDAYGRFELPAMGASARIGARAKGYAPSLLQRLSAAVEGRIPPLRIVLPGFGGGLRCTVRGPDGKPVRNADVSLGEGHWPGAGKKRLQTRIRSTDASGRADFISCPTGDIDVLAWAEGLAPFRGSAVIVPGGRTDLAIQLEPGVTLEGVVRDTSGTPVPGYEVGVGRSKTEAYAEFGSFAFQYTRTDEAGEYRLQGLPPGEIVAQGSGAGAPQTTQTFQATAGDTVRWDPSVDVGHSVRGRVLGPDGKGLKAMVEGGAKKRRNWHVSEVTDEDGRFTLDNVDPELSLQLDVRLMFFPVFSYDGPVPEEGELVLRVPPEGMPSIQLHGTVVDASGQPIPLAEVAVQRGGTGSAGVFPTDDAGRFECGPFPSGEYRVWVSAEGWVRHSYPVVTVEPESTHDFGTTELSPAGSIVVELRSDGPVPGSPYIEAEHEDGTIAGRHGFEDGRSVFGSLRPGTYLVRIRGRGIELVERTVEIPIGETKLEVDVRPAVTVRVVLNSASGADLPSRANVRILDEASKVVIDAERPVGSDGRWRMLSFGLGPGAYRAEVTLEQRLLGTTAFTIDETEGEQTVNVTIR